MGSALAGIKQEWKSFKHDDAGERFQHHRERMEKRSQTFKIGTLVVGIVLLAAGVAYSVLQAALLRVEGRRSLLATAIGRDFKGKASPLLYCLGIGLSFVSGWLALAVYVGVALMWFVPDPRLERRLAAERQGPGGQPR